jgi:sugar phosphate isomerase/epimerase
VAKLPQIAEIAASLGAVRCRTVVMPTCAERPYHENFEFHRHRLAEIAEILSPHGICLGLDFLAPAYHREDSQYHFISTAEPLILLAKTVGMPNVGVTLDVWNWHVGGGNFADLLKELSAEQIVSIRLADLPQDADRETVREEQRLLPGRGGVADSVTVLRHAREIGYEGPVTAYPHPSQCPSKTRDTIVKQAGEILDELWKAMDAEEEVQPASAPAAE